MALLWLPACDHPGAASASDWAGEYERSHRIFVFHGNEPVEVEATDRLVLAATEEGDLRFRLHLFAIGGGECKMEGVAVGRGSSFAYREPGADCRLRLERGERGIVVEDVDSRCRPRVCGGDAAIGRIVLRSPAAG